MPRYEITSPDGKRFEVTAPDGASQADVLAYAQSQFKSSEPDKPYNPTDDMSGPQKFFAGVGKGMVDLGRGAGQMLGIKSQADIDEARKLDAPLMQTGAGVAGNMTGTIAAAVPAMMVPGANSVVGAAALGGAMNALQPTAADESRLKNTAVGAALGGAGQYGLGKLAGVMESRLANKTASEAARQSQNVPRDSALQAARDAGYVTPPSMAEGNLPGRVLEGISGKYKTNQLFGIKNQNMTDALARKAVGLAPDQAITAEALRDVRNQAYQRGYEPVAGLGRIETDATYKAALDNIASKYRGAAADFPGVASDSVSNLVNGTSKGETAARTAWVDDAGKVVNAVVEPDAPKMRSLIEDIKAAGGISTSEINDLGVFGLTKSHPGLVRKGGQSADSLLETMQQRGWINQAEMDAAEGMTGGAQELAKDMLRSALNGDRIVHPSQQEAWYAYDKAMEQIADAGLKKVTIPGSAGELSGGLRVKGFDSANGIKMIQILRDEASDAFRAGDSSLGKAKREAAKALEDQIERGLSAKGKEGAELLKNFREARTLMAKSHNVERALVAEGGKVNANVLGAALQRGKPLTDELKTIGAFANNFKDVAGVPKSGAANPFTIMDFGFGVGTGSPLLPMARVAARYGLLSGPGQRLLASPKYGPGTMERLSPELLKKLEKMGAGGLLGYAAQ